MYQFISCIVYKRECQGRLVEMAGYERISGKITGKGRKSEKHNTYEKYK